MPRGRRAGTGKTIDQQIEKLDTEIENYKIKIAEFRKKKAELAKKKSQGDFSELIDVIKKSGKSPEELLELLKGQEGK